MKDVFLKVSLVNHAFYDAASMDCVWKLFCVRIEPSLARDPQPIVAYASSLAFFSSPSLLRLTLSISLPSLPLSLPLFSLSLSVSTNIVLTPALAVRHPWKSFYTVLSQRVLLAYYAGTTSSSTAHQLKTGLEELGLRCGMQIARKLEEFTLILAPLIDIVEEDNPVGWIDAFINKLDDYKVVMYGNNHLLPGEQNKMLGHALAHFVERGRSVILTAFSNAWTSRVPFICALVSHADTGHTIRGVWTEKNYNPIQPSDAHSKALTLGQVVIPTHYIMHGVHNLDSRCTFLPRCIIQNVSHDSATIRRACCTLVRQS